MATYSEEKFDSSHYNTARPSYPDKFYDTVVDFHKKVDGNTTDLAIDVGCGTGFVAFKLTQFFDKVIGTDVSATMISQCKNDPKTAQLRSKIDFAVAPAEEAPEFVAANSVDLITAAECAHWMDHPRFFAESARILKKNGTLAYWFYLDPVFLNQPRANEIYMDYAYGSSVEKHGDAYERYFGPFYEEPGHSFLRSAMVEVSPPTDLFYDVVRHHYHPDKQKDGASYTTLYIPKHITLRVYRNYVTSWSGYHNWKVAHGDKPDTVDRFMDELQEAMGVDMDTPVDLMFPTVYTFARKK